MSKNTKGATFYTADNYNPDFTKKVELKNRITTPEPYSFCVVGSGPAGFYAAKSITNTSDNIKVDILDAHPHPFGLIRNGVAPDHQAMKKIMYDYDVVFRNPNVQFYGNVTVGKDIQINE